MKVKNGKVHKQVLALPDADKLFLVNAILSELDKPDPTIDRLWATESQRRWKAFKSKKVKSISYASVMSRYKKK